MGTISLRATVHFVLNVEWPMGNLTSTIDHWHYLYYSKVRSNPNPLSSCTNTLNDSGTPGLGIFSPFTIASYVLALPMISSDLSVNNSCNMLEAPYASSAHTSISPKRCPPN